MKIDWKTGIPPFADLYYVAIKLGENSGYFAFSYWDGENWAETFKEQIIAFYRASDLAGKFDIEWPEPILHEPDDNLPPLDLSGDQYEEHVEPALSLHTATWALQALEREQQLHLEQAQKSDQSEIDRAQHAAKAADLSDAIAELKRILSRFSDSGQD